VPNKNKWNSILDQSFCNEIIYEEVEIEEEKNNMNQNLSENKLCDYNCVVSSFDIVNPLSIKGKFTPRRIFTTQTMEYNKRENSFSIILKPCKY
jgi:hypothetical protein